MVFQEIIDKWSSLILPSYRLSTQADVRSQLRKYIQPELGHIDIADLGAERIQRFVVDKLSTTISPRRTRSVIVTLRMIWRKARSWGYVHGNPFEDLTLPRTHVSSRRSFSVDDLHRIIYAADEPYRTIYWLAAETGLRIGEICGLRKTDAAEGQLTITRSVSRGKIGDTKSARANRTVAVSAALFRSIRAQGENRKWTDTRDSSGYLFPSQRGTPLDGGNLARRHLKPLLRRLGVQGSFHSFRHANASMMDQLGAPMKVRQRRLGHARAQTTMDIYTHVANGDDRIVAEKIGGMLR